jgi:hypothetical protein
VADMASGGTVAFDRDVSVKREQEMHRRITIRSVRFHVLSRARRSGPRPRSLRWAVPGHRRRFPHTSVSCESQTLVHLPPLSPEVRNQIVDLLADVLIADYRACLPLPR